MQAKVVVFDTDCQPLRLLQLFSAGTPSKSKKTYQLAQKLAENNSWIYTASSLAARGG
jgi:hypothetical protein